MPTDPDSLPGGADARSGVGGHLRRLLAVEQIRYLLVAGTTSLFYLLLVAAGLETGAHYMVAIGVAQVITIACAFPAYRTLIFRSHRPWRRDLPRFVAVWAGGFVAGVVVTPLLVEGLGVSPLPAQVGAVIGVAILSYLGHRYLSFSGARG